jgi:hypothetical protein
MNYERNRGLTQPLKSQQQIVGETQDSAKVTCHEPPKVEGEGEFKEPEPVNDDNDSEKEGSVKMAVYSPNVKGTFEMKTFEPKDAGSFKLTTYEPGKKNDLAANKGEDSMDEMDEQENVVLDSKALKRKHREFMDQFAEVEESIGRQIADKTGYEIRLSQGSAGVTSKLDRILRNYHVKVEKENQKILSNKN